MKTSESKIEYTRFSGTSAEPENGFVITETPLNLSVNGDSWITFMCTPLELEELALGFLYNEGVISSIDDVASCRICESGDIVDVWLNKQVQKPEEWRRTSGCTGGVTSIVQSGFNGEEIIQMDEQFHISTEDVYEIVKDLYKGQNLYGKAGGVHSSILSDMDQMKVISEDIGRHNTLDKLAGKLLLSDVKSKAILIATTGRISSEMIQKSHRMGASILISRTSPSSLSISLAREMGITLVGYARRNEFKVYSCVNRIHSSELIPTNIENI